MFPSASLFISACAYCALCDSILRKLSLSAACAAMGLSERICAPQRARRLDDHNSSGVPPPNHPSLLSRCCRPCVVPLSTTSLSPCFSIFPPRRGPPLYPRKVGTTKSKSGSCRRPPKNIHAHPLVICCMWSCIERAVALYSAAAHGAARFGGAAPLWLSRGRRD